jgi:glucoamylase
MTFRAVLSLLCLFAPWLVTSLSPSWIGEQYNASLNGLLDNIFPNGTVIASPSRKDPDYYVPVPFVAEVMTVSCMAALLHGSFQWIRDAGMVMGHLVHRYEQGETQHQELILAYALHEQRLQVRSNVINLIQNTPNPSGDFYTGGLGEPKFEVDGTKYTGAWARPQNVLLPSQPS